MKLLLIFALALPLLGEVLFFASPQPMAETPPPAVSASSKTLQSAVNSALFTDSEDDDFFYFALPDGQPKPKFMLGAFELPMAGKEEGYPRQISVDGKSYTLFRSYNQVGGSKTTIVLK